jgi:hypothetical protein
MGAAQEIVTTSAPTGILFLFRRLFFVPIKLAARFTAMDAVAWLGRLAL